MFIEARDPTDPVVGRLIAEQQAELAVTAPLPCAPYALRDGIEFVVGLIEGRAICCGALQPIGPGLGEVKRMYVRPPFRGRGLSRLILAAIEDRAAHQGYHTLRLETGRDLAAANGLYQRAGFEPIPRYGEYVGNPLSVCYQKSLLPMSVGG